MQLCTINIMNNWREKINFILVEPVESGNIGSAARAIKTMGFSRMSIVNPPEKLGPEADWMSHQGLDVLLAASRHDTFSDALSDASLVIGLSRRTGKNRGSFLPIEEAARRIVEAAKDGGVAAVAFGREARGLYNDETEDCSYLVSIPAGGDHPSLNLSHAVQILAYELHKAGLGMDVATDQPGPSEPVPDDPPSTHGEQEHLFGRVMEILEDLNYTKRGDREVGRRIRMSMKHFLGRAGMTKSETLMFEGICSRILSYLRNK